ncbi:MAG TPA: PqqD family protein [Bacteroidales bacterium]|nr:PqqD family protein [Bacteroidales bacterium]
MKLRKNIAVSENGLIFNPATGDSFSVNGTGIDILSCLREDKPYEEIIFLISSKYDAERFQVEKDLDDFVSLLNDYNLIDRSNGIS